jgi:hypothetical protein
MTFLFCFIMKMNINEDICIKSCLTVCIFQDLHKLTRFLVGIAMNAINADKLEF